MLSPLPIKEHMSRVKGTGTGTTGGTLNPAP